MHQLLPGGVALVIVDMQNDFVDKNGFLAKERGLPHECYPPIIRQITELKKAAVEGMRKVFYTAAVYETDASDQYPKRHSHSLLPKSLMDPNGKPWDNFGLCTRGTWGAEIITELSPDKNDRIVFKPRFDAFYQTDLEHLLRSRNIKTVVICGVLTEVCVSNTARQAFMRDFDVIIPVETVGSWNGKAHEEALRDLDSRYAKLMSVREAEDILRNAVDL